MNVDLHVLHSYAIKLKCFYTNKCNTAIPKKQIHKLSNQMSTHKTNANANINFDGIHVSKGFVRGLQGQVLRLEQNQQSLIQQLEHANRLATEYHASAVSWQQKYDAALDENENTRQALERETLLRMSRESELEHFKNLLQEQLAISSSSSSRSRSHTPSPNPPRYYSQQYQDQYPNNDNTMSPVSVASNDYQEDNDSENENEHDSDSDSYDSSYCGEFCHYPREYNWEREAREARGQDQDQEYYEDGDEGEDQNQEYYEDGDEEEEQEQDQNQEYDEGNDAYSQSSRTTDCSGDPICHSDSD